MPGLEDRELPTIPKLATTLLPLLTKNPKAYKTQYKTSTYLYNINKKSKKKQQYIKN